jgi:hypothetical protein
MALNIVLYSLTENSLSGNNRFLFKGIVINVKRIGEIYTRVMAQGLGTKNDCAAESQQYFTQPHIFLTNFPRTV